MSSGIMLPATRGFKNLTGQRFGRLEVVSYAGTRGATKKTAWLCRCDCGNEKAITASSLVCGATSCGCSRLERLRQKIVVHDQVHTPEYRAWAHMIERCEDAGCANYSDYGGRGIAVCARWRESFEAFIADVGPRPSPRHSLDRYPDNDGNYEPANVRWATRGQQSRNTRRNRLLTWNETTLCITDWAEKTGLSVTAIHRRLKAGLSIEAALSTPPGQTRVRKKTIAEHAVDVLRETDNPGVCWGDSGLLDLIGDRAGVVSNPTCGRTWVPPSQRHHQIMQALDRSPLFEKRYTDGSGSRAFYLKQ